MGRFGILSAFFILTASIEASPDSMTVDQCASIVEKLANTPESQDPKEITPRKPILLPNLIARVEEKSKGKLYTHYDYDKDIELSKSRKRFTAPKFLEELLPEGFSFIDHSLIGAMEPGLVKTYGRKSEFISLRVEWDFKGKKLSTNCAIRKTALAQNANRSPKSSLTADSEAVVVFVHGGGTSTTGHHVAHQMMGHFASLGQDVISFDQGWHGEFSRVNFSSDREYYDAFRALIEQRFTAPGKEVEVVGHSMGALFVDQMMRLYPNDKLISHYVALSAVPDLYPGGTLEQKMRAMEDLQKILEDPNSGVAPSDIALTKGLFTQGKMSSLAYFFEQMFAAKLDWTMPAHQGAEFAPTLYVWPEFEWLYRGKEELVKKYISTLKNVTVKTYGEEEDFHGVKKKLGHTDIYDFRRVGRNGELAGAIFLDIQEFIEDGISKKRGQEFRFKKTDFRANHNILHILIGAYANNLAFREFISDYVYRSRESKNPELLRVMGYQLERLKKRTNPKALKLAAENKWKRRMTPEFIQLMKEKAVRFQEILSGTYVPAWTEGDWGRKQVAKINEIKPMIQSLRHEVNKHLRPEIETKEKLLTHIDKELSRDMPLATSDRLQVLTAVLTTLENRMKADSRELDAGIAAHYINAFAGGVSEIPPEKIEPSAELKRLFVQSNDSLKAYQAKLPELYRMQIEEGLANHLRASDEAWAGIEEMERMGPAKIKEQDGRMRTETREEFAVRILNLRDRARNLGPRVWGLLLWKMGADGNSGLVGVLNSLKARLHSLDAEHQSVVAESDALRLNLSLRYVSEFYDVKEISMEELFNSYSPSDLAKLNPILMPVWADWQNTWRDREDPPEKTDAY